ncbi:DJ-1/PfpI family protein [Fictibacillus fluitans]|uniref:DJ-1/PfpI family protein n=1 Tax=Fictibacillus fluitans TaxID=3058422 RepID=A0ABT8I006_9BACL|nr:DJ-1/PfpI family protein [Fictibacillus sp. NE201]MDN4526372.1 DJ-1/PfpI family protein [Fictibacillus sp. NE201]
MKRALRIFMYVMIVIVPFLLTGLSGAADYAGMMFGGGKQDGNYHIKPPAYDRSKPTVVILLGSGTTEVIDFLAPYELFSATKSFNVFAAAPTTDVTHLSGSLDVLPHYSFKQLDKLLGKSPDVIVVPYIFKMKSEKYKPVKSYLRKHAAKASSILSICGGAVNLADAGLLEGKTAATHWSRIGREIKNYPEVKWVRDQRFVEDGRIISSAGLTSGIDASLYLITKLAGHEKAALAADSIHYSGSHFLKNPSIKPHYPGIEDAPYYFNIAFNLNKPKTGVLLYNGIGETSLASIFDTFPAAAAIKTYAVSSSKKPVQTKHNLYVLPRYVFENVPEMNRVYAPGTDARVQAKSEAQKWSTIHPHSKITYLHADQPDRFVLEPPLEELAGRTNLPTADYAVKRLEYRENNLSLKGSPFMMHAAVPPILLLLGSAIIILILEARRKKKIKITA